MRFAYERLFRIRLRHGFYTDGSARDFRLEPSPWCRRELSQHGTLFRAEPDGGSLCVQVEPGSAPPSLFSPLAEQRFQFLLFGTQPYAASVTDLPAHAPGRSVFYFNNLREDAAEGRLHLGDSVAARRVGDPLVVVSGAVLDYVLPVPRTRVPITVRDLFGNTVLATELGDPEQSSTQLRLDLRQAHLTPGYHEARDDQGGVLPFFYAPELALMRPFAVLEVFADTAALTPDQTNRVPAPYRFIEAGVFNVGREYTLQLAARPTIWRYVVVKKYASNVDVDLAGLSITGPVDFDRTLGPDRASFDSSEPMPLSEARSEVSLQHDGTSILALPSPRISTPLSAGAGPNEHVSEMFVYV
jgi:hypothetical protein